MIKCGDSSLWYRRRAKAKDVGIRDCVWSSSMWRRSPSSVMGDGLGRPGVNLLYDLPCSSSHVSYMWQHCLIPWRCCKDKCMRNCEGLGNSSSRDAKASWCMPFKPWDVSLTSCFDPTRKRWLLYAVVIKGPSLRARIKEDRGSVYSTEISPRRSQRLFPPCIFDAAFKTVFSLDILQ